MCYRSVVICLAAVSCGIVAPNVHKTVVIGKQDASNEIGGALGASASWGPYSAGAGLGGNNGGGGLFAGASSPHGTAGAGLGGGSSSSASASASAGAEASGAGATATGSSGVKPQGGTFFDKIFNIPISILHSVNANLNANGRVIPHRDRYIPVASGPDDEQLLYVRPRRRGGVRKYVYVKGDANASANGAAPPPSSSASASASAGASSGPGAANANGSAHTNAQVGVTKNYDAVFNIPITALRSVNEFLNGK